MGIAGQGAPTGFANGGTVDVHRDIAAIDVASDGGCMRMSVVRAKARILPLRAEVMENDPLGSEAIAPLGNAWMLIVVAPARTARAAT